MPGKRVRTTRREFLEARGGNIQWLAQTVITADDLTSAQVAIDLGAAGAFIQGGAGDGLVNSGRLEHGRQVHHPR